MSCSVFWAVQKTPQTLAKLIEVSLDAILLIINGGYHILYFELFLRLYKQFLAHESFTRGYLKLQQMLLSTNSSV